MKDLALRMLSSQELSRIRPRKMDRRLRRDPLPELRASSIPLRDQAQTTERPLLASTRPVSLMDLEMNPFSLRAARRARVDLTLRKARFLSLRSPKLPLTEPRMEKTRLPKVESTQWKDPELTTARPLAKQSAQSSLPPMRRPLRTRRPLMRALRALEFPRQPFQMSRPALVSRSRSQAVTSSRLWSMR